MSGRLCGPMSGQEITDPTDLKRLWDWQIDLGVLDLTGVFSLKKQKTNKHLSCIDACKARVSLLPCSKHSFFQYSSDGLRLVVVVVSSI